jgi:hypothetical protein
MIISFSAKCSDLFGATLTDMAGNQLGQDYDGYVPDWFPDEHFGDYVMLDVNVLTGKIVNWRVPTSAELNKTFKFK